MDGHALGSEESRRAIVAGRFDSACCRKLRSARTDSLAGRRRQSGGAKLGHSTATGF